MCSFDIKHHYASKIAFYTGLYRHKAFMDLGWEEMKGKKSFSHIISSVLRVLDWRQANSIAQFISIRKWMYFYIPEQQMAEGIAS